MSTRVTLVALVVALGPGLLACVQCREDEVREGNQCVRLCNTDPDCGTESHCADGRCEAGPGAGPASGADSAPPSTSTGTSHGGASSTSTRLSSSRATTSSSRSGTSAQGSTSASADPSSAATSATVSSGSATATSDGASSSGTSPSSAGGSSSGVPHAVALRLEVVDENNLVARQPFDAVVRAVGIDLAEAPVQQDTTVVLSVTLGAGSLSGETTGLLRAGTSQVQLVGLVYDRDDASLDLQVDVQSGDVLDADSRTLSFSPREMHRLEFTVQPGHSTQYAAIPGPPQVRLRDEAGVTVLADRVRVTVQSNCALSGTTTGETLDGVAAFTDLRIAQNRTGCVLTADADGMQSATSAPFTVSSLYLDGMFARPIAVLAGGDALPAGYAVRAVVDLQAMWNAGHARADAEDLRVSFLDQGSRRELDRVLSSWTSFGARAVEVWFALQAPISPGGADTGYCLHYGEDNAREPPRDGSRVFLLWDDFEDGLIDSALWTVHVTATTQVEERAGRLVVAASSVSGLDSTIPSGIVANTGLVGFQVMVTFGIVSQSADAWGNWHGQLGFPSGGTGLGIKSMQSTDKRVMFTGAGGWETVGDSTLDAQTFGPVRVNITLNPSGQLSLSENGQVAATRSVNATRQQTPTFTYAADAANAAFEVWFDDVMVRPVVDSDGQIGVNLGAEIAP